MSAGRYWMRLSNLLTVAASSSTVPASRLPRSRLTCAHTPSVALSSGGVGRQLNHGQPALVRLADLAHRGAGVHVESEVGRRRRSRGSGPFPSAPSRTVRAALQRLTGWGLCQT